MINELATNSKIYGSFLITSLPLSWRSSLSYKNQSINALSKSMDWFLYDCVHLGIKPLQKHHPIFFCQAPLKSANCPSRPPFKVIRPIFLYFCDPPPPKNQRTPIILTPSLTPSHLLKVTEFLVKVSQFKFLVIIEENICL